METQTYNVIVPTLVNGMIETKSKTDQFELTYHEPCAVQKFLMRLPKHPPYALFPLAGPAVIAWKERLAPLDSWRDVQRCCHNVEVTDYRQEGQLVTLPQLS